MAGAVYEGSLDTPAVSVEDAAAPVEEAARLGAVAGVRDAIIGTVP